MERTIKFRGKSISGDWVYGDLIQLDNQSCIAGLHQWATALQNNSLELGVDEIIPETIGQFTGLKDRNGVAIFEGDIVIIGTTSSVIKYFPKYGMFGLTGKSAYKKFDESDPMGSGGSSTRYKPYVLSEYYQRRMEVVGNIHDNPELTTNLE